MTMKRDPEVAMAATTLRSVVRTRMAGYTWAQVANIHGYPNSKIAKKAAKRAARTTQRWLLENERALIPGISGLQKQAFQLDYFPEGKAQGGS